MALIRNLFKSISWEEARRLLRVVAAPIIELGRARIAVPGRLLHVLELGAVLERRGDECSPHRVRRVAAIEADHAGGQFDPRLKL